MKAKRLVEGEYVVLETRQHGSSLLKSIVGYSFLFFLLVAIFGLLARNSLDAFNRTEQMTQEQTPWINVSDWLAQFYDIEKIIIGVLMMIVLVLFLHKLWLWSGRRYIFTNKRIIIKQSSLKSPNLQLNYQLSHLSSQDIRVKKGPLQRIVGSADMRIYAHDIYDRYTGQMMPGGHIDLKNVPQADKVVTLLMQERNVDAVQEHSHHLEQLQRRKSRKSFFTGHKPKRDSENFEPSSAAMPRYEDVFEE